MRTTAIIKVCAECGIAFSTLDKRKIYCKRSCSAKANNRKRGGIPLKDCLGICSNKISALSGANYCSKDCKHMHLLKMWMEGEWTPETLEFPTWLREIVIDNGCSICGWNEENIMTGKRPVQIDHKNGDSTDHRFINIQALCPNCHSLTWNYGALNKGNGRRLRVKNSHLEL